MFSIREFTDSCFAINKIDFPALPTTSYPNYFTFFIYKAENSKAKIK